MLSKLNATFYGNFMVFKNLIELNLTWDLPERPTTDLDFQIFAKSSIMASKWLISPANRKIFISATEFWLSLKKVEVEFFVRAPFNIFEFLNLNTLTGDVWILFSGDALTSIWHHTPYVTSHQIKSRGYFHQWNLYFNSVGDLRSQLYSIQNKPDLSFVLTMTQYVWNIHVRTRIVRFETYK